MVSGDANIVQPQGAAAERLAIQRLAVDVLDVAVWPQQHGTFATLGKAVRGSYDVITAQDPFWRGIFGWKLALLTGAKFNVQVHSDLRAVRGVRRLVARFVLRRADTIRVVSDRGAEEVRALRLRGRVSVLPMYLPLERFRAVVRNPAEPPIILWVGRMEVEKNPLEAIHLFGELLKQGVRAELVMLGKGSLMHAAAAASKHLPVRLLGWQDPIPFLAQASVVVSTSPYESWGASIIEALAAGVPVVSYDVGVAKEAGAIITTKEKIIDVLVRVLTSHPEGRLNLTLLDADAWQKAWRASLV